VSRIARAVAALVFVTAVSCANPPEENLGQDQNELRPESAGVSATLTASRSTFGAADPVSVTLTIHNTGKSALQMLRWQGPSERLEEPLFAVTRDGLPVQYIGAHYKRPPPTQEDLLTIAPGKSLSQEMSLSGFYDFSNTGSYTLRYQVASLSVGAQTGTLRSNELTLWIEGRINVIPESPAGDVTTDSITGYTACDTTQQSLLVTATANATTYSTGAKNYLAGTGSGTPRYTTWFGAYTSTRWSTARAHYTAIEDAFLTKPITYNCKCKQNYYAYVYPTQPYAIYLCKVFWQAPATGTDSKAGTLVHEMSHFNVTAGTDDWVYGQSGAKSLAISDPTKALNNADNHEYFAENTPAQQ
jgi:peptidyl-Lys metalloendopeptidase